LEGFEREGTTTTAITSSELPGSQGKKEHKKNFKNKNKRNMKSKSKKQVDLQEGYRDKHMEGKGARWFSRKTHEESEAKEK